MKSLDQYQQADLKHIYRTLHAQLQQDFELMDSELLHPRRMGKLAERRQTAGLSQRKVTGSR